MFVTKKEFYNEVLGIVNDGIKDIKKAKSELEYLKKQKSSGNYTADYVRDYLDVEIKKAEKNVNETIPGRYKASLSELCASYKAELIEDERLRASDLNEDVKLLNLGIKLNKGDIESMLARNAKNRTMTQLILRYADQNKIDVGRHYVGNESVISMMETIPYTAEVVFRWVDDPGVYNRLMGEGSDMQRAFPNEV